MTVYAVAMFLVYSWTLFVSFWKLPSWLFFLTIGEVLSIYSYAFLVNFIESLMLLFLVLVPGVALPRRWWLDTFIAKGFLLMLVVLGSAVLHLSLYRTPDVRAAFVNGQLLWWVATFWIAVFLTWIVGRVEWALRGLEVIADRAVVFLYIYAPLTVLALVFVAARIFL